MNLRSRLPQPVQGAVRAGYIATGRSTAGLRVLPDVIVVGAQRCGTTSLFRALSQHPQVVRPTFNKGINYFDLNYHRGPAWYAAHFPLRVTARRRVPEGEPVVFESSGYYMFHPLAPARIAKDLPAVRLVAMLRDPVERAFSAWKHESARGYESLPFVEALRHEDERLRGQAERMISEPGYASQSHRHHAYQRRGDYVAQLQRLYELFPREQVHVVYSEDFFSRPQEEFARLCQFLGLPRVDGLSFEQHNARPSSSMPLEARAILTHALGGQTDELERLVGRRPPWALAAEPTVRDGDDSTAHGTAP